MSEKQFFAERYEIQQKLGQGSFGIAYRALDTRLGGRTVALKVIHPQLAIQPETLRLFETEAGLLARLRHDHIVTVYDAGLWQGVRYITMEQIEGPSLSQLLQQKGAQPAEQVNRWLRQAAAALAHAHDRQVLHRDIKPSNLLLDQTRDRLYIVDFGLALVVGSSGGSSASQQMQQLTGTAAYRAPEVTQTGHTVASDLYSLGVVAYELLAGRRPFLGDDPLTLLSLHANAPVPPLPVDCPPALGRLVLRLLEKQPARRFADAHELRAALRFPVVTPSAGPGMTPAKEDASAQLIPDSEPDIKAGTELPKRPWIRFVPGDSQPRIISPGIFVAGMGLLLLVVFLLYLALSAGLAR